MEGLRGKAGFSTHTHSDDFNGGGGGTLRSIYARTVHAFGVVERASCVSARERERARLHGERGAPRRTPRNPNTAERGAALRRGQGAAWAWLAAGRL